MEIVSLKYDYCVKEVFQNEVVRKYFISDILGIPVEEIRSIRIVNPFLRKRYRKQKQGIVDLLLELNDDRWINIELQLRTSVCWDKRQMFYLSKMYVSDAKSGEDYQKLKKCIAISILDFELTKREEYHSVYLMRDKNGNVFSDVFELHILELCKPLNGTNVMDDWIRVFNAESREELDMIKSANPGIREAIKELKQMGLTGILRYEYEMHQKYIRDKRAQDEYVRQEGEARFARLADVLLETERQGDLQRAIEDEKYRKVLYEELGL